MQPKTLIIDELTARKIFPTASAELKEILQQTFGKDFFSMKITDRVKDFNDILSISGKTMQDLCNPGDEIDEIAYKQAKLIAAVYNEGTVLDAYDTNQYKYFPWHKISGSGLSFNVCVYWLSDSYVGVRLCFKNSDLAIDAGKKFIDVYTNLKTK